MCYSLNVKCTSSAEVTWVDWSEQNPNNGCTHGLNKLVKLYLYFPLAQQPKNKQEVF